MSQFVIDAPAFALLGLFAGISDGRVGPGRDHPVAAVLALAAAAVVAGMKGYTAITGWVMSFAGLTAPAAAGRGACEEDCRPALMQVRLDGKAIRGAKGR